MPRSAGAPPSSSSWPRPRGSTRRPRSNDGASDGGVERVALARRSRLVADREPVLPLGGRPMGPALGIDLALRLGLDPVVADRRGRVQRFADLLLRRRFEETGRGGVVGPDAGVAVGLELGPHRATARA